MKKEKILIADCDERVIQCLIEAIEKEENMEVVATTGNGMELLNFIQEHQPDLVIMDLILPWIDGIRVLEQIQKEGEIFSHPKILVLTKLNNERIIQEAFSLGICYYMLKPFHVKFVMERLKQISKIENWGKEDYIQEEIEFRVQGEQKSHNKALKQNENTKELKWDKMTLESKIMNKISEMGIPHHIKGFRYLETAIFLCVEDMNRLNGITKDLYPSIAKKYETTSSRVERGIRHAIEVACDRKKKCKDSVIDQQEFAFLTGDHRPTNSEFIAFVSDQIRISLN